MTRFPSGEMWSALEASLMELPTAVRASLTEGWSEAAQQEHASIASFSKFSLELMAVGAPPALLTRAHEAALDEINHARMSFRVASLCASQALGPGPLAFSLESLGQTMSLKGSSIAAALDGCLNETIAALEARAAAESAKHEALRMVLDEIASDEQAHSELAWEYVAWAIGVGGPALREAIQGSVEVALRRLEAEQEPAVQSDHGAWGLLEPRVRNRLRARASREVLRPAFEQLLRVG